MIKNKQRYVLEIIKRLKETFSSVKCPLNFSNPFELLVATILSAQCSDERVNKITVNLFTKYKKLQDYANAKVSEFENCIRSSGFFRSKAKSIINSAKMILGVYGGKVPQRMEELIKLPGVGRKTANVVLGYAFCKSEGVAVDTHVIRIARLLKLTKNEDPVKIEKNLMEVVPKKSWVEFPLLIQTLGRKTCKARNPNCCICPISSICLSARKI